MARIDYTSNRAADFSSGEVHKILSAFRDMEAKMKGMGGAAKLAAGDIKSMGVLREFAESAGVIASHMKRSASASEEFYQNLREAMKDSAKYRHISEMWAEDLADGKADAEDIRGAIGEMSKDLERSKGLENLKKSFGMVGEFFADLSEKRKASELVERKHANQMVDISRRRLELEAKRVTLAEKFNEVRGKRDLAARLLRPGLDPARQAKLESYINEGNAAQTRVEEVDKQLGALSIAEQGLKAKFSRDLAESALSAAKAPLDAFFRYAVKPVAELQFKVAREMSYLSGGQAGFLRTVEETRGVQGANPLLDDQQAVELLRAFKDKSRTLFPNGDKDIETAGKLSYALNISAQDSSEIAFNLKKFGHDGAFGRIANQMAAFAKQTDLTGDEVANLVKEAQPLVLSYPKEVEKNLIPQVLAIGDAFKRAGLDAKGMYQRLQDASNLFSEGGVMSAVFSTGNGVSLEDVMSGRNMAKASGNFVDNVNKFIRSSGLPLNTAAQMAADMFHIPFEEALRMGQMNDKARTKFKQDLVEREELAKQSSALDDALNDQMEGPMQMFKTWGTVFSNVLKSAGIWAMRFVGFFNPVFSLLSSFGSWLAKSKIGMEVLGVAALGAVGYLAFATVSIGKLTRSLVGLASSALAAARATKFGSASSAAEIAGTADSVAGRRFAGGKFGRFMGKAGAVAAVAGLADSLLGVTDKMGKFGEVLSSVLSWLTIAGLAFKAAGLLGLGAGGAAGAGSVAAGSGLLASGAALGKAGLASASRVGLGISFTGAEGAAVLGGAGASTGSMAAGLAANTGVLAAVAGLITGSVLSLKESWTNDDGLSSTKDATSLSGLGSNLSAGAYRILNAGTGGMLNSWAGVESEEDAKKRRLEAAKHKFSLSVASTDSSLDHMDVLKTPEAMLSLTQKDTERSAYDIALRKREEAESAAKAKQEEEARRAEEELRAKREDRQAFRSMYDAYMKQTEAPLMFFQSPTIDLTSAAVFSSSRTALS